jgi:hypothetical protein
MKRRDFNDFNEENTRGQWITSYMLTTIICAFFFTVLEA